MTTHRSLLNGVFELKQQLNFLLDYYHYYTQYNIKVM